MGPLWCPERCGFSEDLGEGSGWFTCDKGFSCADFTLFEVVILELICSARNSCCFEGKSLDVLSTVANAQRRFSEFVCLLAWPRHVVQEDWSVLYWSGGSSCLDLGNLLGAGDSSFSCCINLLTEFLRRKKKSCNWIMLDNKFGQK